METLNKYLLNEWRKYHQGHELVFCILQIYSIDLPEKHSHKWIQMN